MNLTSGLIFLAAVLIGAGVSFIASLIMDFIDFLLQDPDPEKQPDLYDMIQKRKIKESKERKRINDELRKWNI